MLRKGRDLFHKQHSDDMDMNSSHSKTKLAKIVVECRKEGIVNYSTPESLDQPGGPPKWERCRLALVKAVGGYMLEFYSPPKSTKVKKIVFVNKFKNIVLFNITAKKRGVLCFDNRSTRNHSIRNARP